MRTLLPVHLVSQFLLLISPKFLSSLEQCLIPKRVGFFYGGFGAILTPIFGVRKSYGDDVAQYNNALGFFMISRLCHSSKSERSFTVSTVWSVLNLFLLFGAIPMYIFSFPRNDPSNGCRNLAYIGIYFFTELSFVLIAASYFATADGNLSTSSACRKAGGVFGFLGGMCGWYTMFHLMAQRTFSCSFPLGDTSRFFKKRFWTLGDL